MRPPLLTLFLVILLILSFAAGRESWAACPTGTIEIYRDGVPRPECLSETEFRSQQLHQDQIRLRQQQLSEQRSLRDRQAQTLRQQRRLTIPQR